MHHSTLRFSGASFNYAYANNTYFGTGVQLPNLLDKNFRLDTSSIQTLTTVLPTIKEPTVPQMESVATLLKRDIESQPDLYKAVMNFFTRGFNYQAGQIAGNGTSHLQKIHALSSLFHNNLLNLHQPNELQQAISNFHFTYTGLF